MRRKLAGLAWTTDEATVVMTEVERRQQEQMWIGNFIP
jgi:hypothetical protein